MAPRARCARESAARRATVDGRKVRPETRSVGGHVDATVGGVSGTSPVASVALSCVAFR